MTLYRDLLITLIQANQACPLLSGKILHFEQKTLVLLPAQNQTRFWLLLRWILIMIFSGEIFFRIAHINLIAENDAFYPKRIQITLCGLVLFICISIGERYRVRGKCPEEFVEFLHQMFFIETRYFKADKITPSVKIRATKFLCLLSFYVCIAAVPLSLTLASVLEPCLPFNPVWFLSEHCNYLQHLKSSLELSKIGFTLFVNLITWETLAMGGFCMIADILLGTAALVLCQHFMLAKLLETFENYYDNLHPDPLSRIFKKTVVVYRAFQIVVESYNYCMRTIFFTFLIFCGTCQVGSASMLIAQTQGNLPIMSWPLKIFFFAVVVETFLIILIVYGFPADFYQDSLKGLANVRKQINYPNLLVGYKNKKRKYFTKFLASCPPIKIRLGLSNFIEKTTPPTLQMFCTCRIIDVLLVK